MAAGSNTYQELLKRHLADYKLNRLGVIQNGLWKGNGRRYAHILPVELQRLNIIEGYRAEFWKYWPRTRSLHSDFHHLNSSQAMCFNLFFPMLSAPHIMQELFQVRSGAVDVAQFERILDAK